MERFHGAELRHIEPDDYTTEGWIIEPPDGPSIAVYRGKPDEEDDDNRWRVSIVTDNMGTSEHAADGCPRMTVWVNDGDVYANSDEAAA